MHDDGLRVHAKVNSVGKLAHHSAVSLSVDDRKFGRIGTNASDEIVEGRSEPGAKSGLVFLVPSLRGNDLVFGLRPKDNRTRHVSG